ncbi:MAG: MarR family winged helix-turn-helix transcriptional regulator [Hyphomicrobiaceae bacterium]
MARPPGKSNAPVKKRSTDKAAKIVALQDPYEILRLENQLCFALYAATRAMTKTYRLRLEPLNLTYPQYLVLIVLWEQDGVTVSDIGQRLMLDSGTLTPLLKRLERMGLVRRERSHDDEREVRISLTEKGRGLRDEARDARLFVACRLGMSEAAIRDLRADLMDMVRQLDAAEVEADVEAVPED